MCCLTPLFVVNRVRMCGSYLWRRLGKAISFLGQFCHCANAGGKCRDVFNESQRVTKTKVVTQPHGYHHDKEISAITSARVNSCILLVLKFASTPRFLLLILERLSMTFTANGKRQKWNFCLLSSAPCTVESKHLYLEWIVRDTFLFLYDLFRDKMKRIENQR